MAGSDLPFPNNARVENTSLFGGARLGRKKRTIFLILLVTVFFVLWFNSDIERLNGSNTSVEDSNTAKESAEHTKTPTIIQDEAEDELNEQEQEEQEEEDQNEVIQEPKEDKKPNIVYNPPTTIYQTIPQHFRYLIVIASRTSNLSRRQLIRKTYFGLNDNVEPCMKRDKGINYLFWLYGDEPVAKTAERRLFETEKMEWNDMEVANRKAYDQDDVLKWAETTLKDKGVTYDYLIIQDGYSLIQLNYIQQTIQAEVGKFPVEKSGKSPFDLVWVSPENKNTLVAGSVAVKKLLEPEEHIKDVITEGDNTLMANFYDFYRSISTQLNFVTAKKEVSRLQAFMEGLPFFVDHKNRFSAWENNVESIPELAISVANLYQDSDFTSAAKALNLGPAGICKPLEKASIAVVTSSYIYPDSCMEPSASLAADNKRKYALAHNYAFVARSTEFTQQSLRADKRRPVWGKIDVVQKVLPKYDWIFWMDMDAVILNPDFTVQGILDNFRKEYVDGPRGFEKNIDLVIAKPTKDKMINAGVFFMRNTEWAQKFLNAVQESKDWYNKGPSYEQGAMWDLIQQPGYKEHVLLLENDDHTFNTLPTRYIPGDFIVHFAPEKCPNSAVLSGLRAAEQIQQGEMVTSFKE